MDTIAFPIIVERRQLYWLLPQPLKTSRHLSRHYRRRALLGDKPPRMSFFAIARRPSVKEDSPKATAPGLRARGSILDPGSTTKLESYDQAYLSAKLSSASSKRDEYRVEQLTFLKISRTLNLDQAHISHQNRDLRLLSTQPDKDVLQEGDDIKSSAAANRTYFQKSDQWGIRSL